MTSVVGGQVVYVYRGGRWMRATVVRVKESKLGGLQALVSCQGWTGWRNVSELGTEATFGLP